jgi:putative ABC transport system substrate-binding protein
VTVIAAHDLSSTVVAKAATATIPIVFVSGGDPVKLGLVASLNRPGGNVTGVSGLGGMLVPKRLEVLHELVPAATKFAVLVNPANQATMQEAILGARAARRLGLEIIIVEASTENEIEKAFVSNKGGPGSLPKMHISRAGAIRSLRWVCAMGCPRPSARVNPSWPAR